MALGTPLGPVSVTVSMLIVINRAGAVSPRCVLAAALADGPVDSMRLKSTAGRADRGSTVTAVPDPVRG
jgi:hypothetical protein